MVLHLHVCNNYRQLPITLNLQGKLKKVRVIESSKKIAESKVKNSFYCTVNILITFNKLEKFQVKTKRYC